MVFQKLAVPTSSTTLPLAPYMHGEPVALDQQTPDQPVSISDAANTRSVNIANKRPLSRCRRLAMLKRSGLFTANTLGADVERVWQLSEFRDAFRLVHDTFVDAGYIRPTVSGMRIRPFDALPDMATFIAFSESHERTIGVLSVLGDQSNLGLPGDSVFGAELDALRAQGSRLCEVTNQAVANGFRKSGVCTELMRCGLAHSLAMGFTDAIAIVSPSHAGTYKLLGFEQVGDVRSYSQTIHDPVIAMQLNIDRFRNPAVDEDAADAFVREFMVDLNPYNAKVQGWEQHAKSFFNHPRLLRSLFVMEEMLLQRCTSFELQAIRNRWGAEIFAEVMGRCRPAGYSSPAIKLPAIKANLPESRCA